MSIDLHTQQVEYAVEIVIVEEIDLQQPFRMLAVGVGDATGETDRASEMAVKRLNERADIRFGLNPLICKGLSTLLGKQYLAE